MRIKLLFLTLFIGWISAVVGQEVTVGSGSASTKDSPLNTYYYYSWSSSIYKGTEINKSGKITKLSYNVTSGSCNKNIEVKVYMRETIAMTPATGKPNPSDFTLVYTGTPNWTGWTELTLTTPFTYSKNKNLLKFRTQ